MTSIAHQKEVRGELLFEEAMDSAGDPRKVRPLGLDHRAGFEDLELVQGEDTVHSTHRVSNFTYFPQQEPHHCGPATHGTVQITLGDHTADYQRSVSALSPSPEVGTPNIDLVAQFLKDFGSERAQQGTGADLQALKQLLVDEWLVVVNFREPVTGKGHYAIVQAVSDRAIELADPYYGLQFVVPLEKFDWRSGYTGLTGWYLAVRE